jgi:hypothetical protein
MPYEVEEIKQLLRLEPHPTCGLVAASHKADHEIPVDALPPGYDAPRALASVLYFLVTPDAQIALHRIRCEQMYHHYAGDPLEVLMLRPDGSASVATVGLEPAAGIQPQLVIPGQTWHVSRLRAGGRYALLGTTEWPAFEPPDLELGDITELAQAYPAFADELRSFAGAPSTA